MYAVGSDIIPVNIIFISQAQGRLAAYARQRGKLIDRLLEKL